MARYLIWNGTDGITATPDHYTSKKKAQQVIDDKRAMFQKLQGYYRTNSGERISPQDIDYRIVRIEKGSSVLETACGVFSERIKTE